ncbi:MAG TPA: hypothetical protein VMI75_08080 [Polyangiaceae bacterium]|nr:hypothetical protein [Polyangiaceae bacterium]
MPGRGDKPTKDAPTERPPFDPDTYARNSEALINARRPVSTAEVPSPPPLNKRVSMAVPAADLDWFGLSEDALAFTQRIDGTKTLLELMEGAQDEKTLNVIAELHDAGVLAYEK